MEQQIAVQFRRDAVVVDKLDTQASTLDDGSHSKKANPQNIPSALVKILRDSKAATKKYKKARKLTALFSDEVDTKILELGNRAIERQ